MGMRFFKFVSSEGEVLGLFRMEEDQNAPKGENWKEVSLDEYEELDQGGVR